MRIELSLRSVFSILGIIIGLWLLVQLWQIVLLLIIAAILAGTLNPVVDWLEAHRVKRAVALTLILLALVGGIVGLAFLVVPALISQVTSLIAGAPALQQRLADGLEQYPLLAERAAAIREFRPEQILGTVSEGALPLAGLIAESATLGLTTVVLTFYLLADRERTVGFLYALLPRHYHVRTARILLDMERIVGGYVRGQALTGAMMGTFIFILLWSVGTPNVLALAVLAVVADLIPFVGGILILVPAVLSSLAVGTPQAGIVFVAILLYQEFESRFLVPRVYGQALRLSPVAVTVALLVGGKLLGIVGALLALPLAAGIRVLIEDLRIELPGEAAGERSERAVEDDAEDLYERRAAGASAVDAAVIATELAEKVNEEVEALQTDSSSAAPETANGTVPPSETRL